MVIPPLASQMQWEDACELADSRFLSRLHPRGIRVSGSDFVRNSPRLVISHSRAQLLRHRLLARTERSTTQRKSFIPIPSGERLLIAHVHLTR
jgi:hypothetical protein